MIYSFKKFIFLVLVINFTLTNAFAIDWHELNSFKGRSYIDKDSITKTDKYYYYNVKFFTDTNDALIVTVQSSLNSPFSARIKVYKPNEYEALNGDYKNIQKNSTENLEPVYYGSIVNSAYKYVKTAEAIKNNSLTISNE